MALALGCTARPDLSFNMLDHNPVKLQESLLSYTVSVARHCDSKGIIMIMTVSHCRTTILNSWGGSQTVSPS